MLLDDYRRGDGKDAVCDINSRTDVRRALDSVVDVRRGLGPGVVWRLRVLVFRTHVESRRCDRQETGLRVPVGFTLVDDRQGGGMRACAVDIRNRDTLGVVVGRCRRPAVVRPVADRVRDVETGADRRE